MSDRDDAGLPDKLDFRTVNGENVETFSAEELILVLPNGIEVSLYPPAPGDSDIVFLIKAHRDERHARLIIKPGAVNQMYVSAEHFGPRPE